MHFINTLRAFAVVAACAFAAPAFAQAQGQAPAPTPLAIDKLTPAQIALGKEVVMLSGIYRTFIQPGNSQSIQSGRDRQ